MDESVNGLGDIMTALIFITLMLATFAMVLAKITDCQ